MEEEFEEFEDEELGLDETEEEKPVKQPARPQPQRPVPQTPKRPQPQTQEIRKPAVKQPVKPVEEEPQKEVTMEDVVSAIQNISNALTTLDQRLNTAEAALFRLKGAI